MITTKRSGETLNIFVSGGITSGKQDFFGFQFDDGTNDTDSIIQQIQFPDTKKLSVYVDSFGGDYFAGTKLANAIKMFNGETESFAMGCCYSAATLPYLACKKRNAGIGTSFLIHRVSGKVAGNQNDIKAKIEEFNQIDNSLLDFYEKSLTINRAEIEKMLNADTTFDSKKALEIGFANAEIGGEPPVFGNSLEYFLQNFKSKESELQNKLLSSEKQASEFKDFCAEKYKTILEKEALISALEDSVKAKEEKEKALVLENYRLSRIANNPTVPTVPENPDDKEQSTDIIAKYIGIK